jgi:hypothetical protein
MADDDVRPAGRSSEGWPDPKRLPLSRYSNAHFVCNGCGRQWMVYGRAAGFVKKGARDHAVSCAHRSPEARRSQNANDEQRWKKRPPTHSVWNDPGHHGLFDASASEPREARTHPAQSTRGKETP